MLQEIDQIKEAKAKKLKNYCMAIPAVKFSADTPSPRMKQIVPAPPTLRSLPDGTNPYSMYINVSKNYTSF